MLAEIPNSAPAGYAAWIACAAFTVVLLRQGLLLADRFSGKAEKTHITPQPLEVREALEFVSREDFKETTDRIEADIKKLESSLSTLAQNQRQDVGAIYGELKPLRESVAALAASSGLHTQHLASLEAAILRSLERQAKP